MDKRITKIMNNNCSYKHDKDHERWHDYDIFNLTIDSYCYTDKKYQSYLCDNCKTSLIITDHIRKIQENTNDVIEHMIESIENLNE